MKRTGQLNLIEAACYPRDASPANTGLAPPPTADQYPSVVLSTDKVHIKLGKSFSAHSDVDGEQLSSAGLLLGAPSPIARNEERLLRAVFERQ